MSTSALAAPCPVVPATQAFAQFGDADLYRLVPSGNFESGFGSWTTSGQASIFGQNNVFNLSGTGFKSARIVGSASLTSPSVCVDDDHPYMRFVLRPLITNGNTRMKIEALWTENGTTRSTKLADENSSGGTEWRPSGKIPLSTKLPIAAGGSLNVRFEFSDVGNDSDWLIDDVFIDPRASR